MDVELEIGATFLGYLNSKGMCIRTLHTCISTQSLFEILNSEVEQRLIDKNIYVAMVCLLGRLWGYDNTVVKVREYANSRDQRSQHISGVGEWKPLIMISQLDILFW